MQCDAPGAALVASCSMPTSWDRRRFLVHPTLDRLLVIVVVVVVVVVIIIILVVVIMII
jgi:hypothetical protein